MATAVYNGLRFDTALLAQWAAFFDLAGWRWSRDVESIGDWKPDYRVSFDCGHSECNGSHTILISVLPITDIETVKGHPALRHFFGVTDAVGASIADAGAVFGVGPSGTCWQMSHGAGGGIEDATNWADDAGRLWIKAKAEVDLLGAKPLRGSD